MRYPDVTNTNNNNKMSQLFSLLLFAIIFKFTGCYSICTYNIWNNMFNWPVRKQRIAEMVKYAKSDIIALQEVRGARVGASNQLLELQALLPAQYRWQVFRVATNVTSAKRPIQDPWPAEGLGLISRFPIISSSVQVLAPRRQDPDKNRRIALHVSIQPPDDLTINIVVVHLSYHRKQQCRNTAEILGFIAAKHLKNVIIVGDFNAYSDYEWPVQSFIGGRRYTANSCNSELSKFDLLSVEMFQDAWVAAKPGWDGLTFSNMPTPGYESRPDRILVNKNLRVTSVHLDGNGTRYRTGYKASIHWSRFTQIIQSTYLSHQGVAGYPCHHDCGPHGSCQCGVCSVHQDTDCLLPHCSTCDDQLFGTIVIHFLIFLIIISHICFSIVIILIVGANSYGETLFSILGCNCCLCNPKLLMSSVRLKHRKSRFLRYCHLWPLFRLPPYILLFVSVVSLLMFYLYIRSIYSSVLELTYDTMEEEFYPSDHLMLTASIE